MAYLRRFLASEVWPINEHGCALDEGGGVFRNKLNDYVIAFAGAYLPILTFLSSYAHTVFIYVHLGLYAYLLLQVS